MIHILQTNFFEDVINTLENKYKIIPQTKEELYTYANIYTIPLYYNLFSYKNNPDYGLYNKILNHKIYDVIILSIKTIQENNYNKKQILLLYSYICNLAFTYYFDEYIQYKAQHNTDLTKMNTFSKTAKIIEKQFFEERFYTNINKYRISANKLIIDNEVLDLINDIFSKVYLMSYGIKIFNKSFNHFKSYQKKKFSKIYFHNKIIAGTLDAITKSKKYSAASIYNIRKTTEDYLNKDNKIWIKNSSETSQSFYDLYDEAIKFTVNFITIISEKIYYKSKNDELILKQINSLKKTKE